MDNICFHCDCQEYKKADKQPRYIQPVINIPEGFDGTPITVRLRIDEPNRLPEPFVGVDIKRVENDILTLAAAMCFISPRTWLEVSVESGELEESQWVSAALGCNDDKQMIEIALEGFVGAIKAGEYGLYIDHPAG
jgi:hypothetical protein